MPDELFVYLGHMEYGYGYNEYIDIIYNGPQCTAEPSHTSVDQHIWANSSFTKMLDSRLGSDFRASTLNIQLGGGQRSCGTSATQGNRSNYDYSPRLACLG